MDGAAPLLCAGITVLSPMKESNLIQSPGKRIGVVGLGGLGHVFVKFGKAFGHYVTVISTSPCKEREAKERLGADDFIVSTSVHQMQMLGGPLLWPLMESPWCLVPRSLWLRNLWWLLHVLWLVSLLTSGCLPLSKRHRAPLLLCRSLL